MLQCMCLALQALAKEVFPLVGGFHDTPFIVYMLKTQSWRGRSFLDGVFFEQDVQLNRHWVQAGAPWDHVKLPAPACAALCSCFQHSFPTSTTRELDLKADQTSGL